MELVLLYLIMTHLYVLPTHAGVSLFDIVAEKMSKREFSNDNDIHVNDENSMKDFVSAEDIWDEDRIKKMLGLDYDEIGESREENIDSFEMRDQEVPSLLSALYNKMNEPGSTVIPLKCKIPGMKGNVVRMLNNKGSVIYQNRRQTIVELSFSMKYALHEYENITEAKLKIPAPYHADSTKQELWQWFVDNGLMAYPQYKYEVYYVTDDVMKKMKIKSMTWKKDNTDLDKVDEQIAISLGSSITVKHYMPSMKSKQNTLSIDIKPIVQKWRTNFFKIKKRTLSKAILVVTMETESILTKQCKQMMVANSRILLVSLDRRQCPMPMTSYSNENEVFVETNDVIVEDSNIKRRKRSVTDDKASKRRKTKSRKKSKNDQKSLFWNGRQNAKSSHTPDLVRGRSLHTGHSRAVRSTICRRYPMHVSFDDVGWGKWIIAPRGYQAHRCEGECPFPLGGRLNGTNHAVLMTMMHSVEPWSSPQPCCVPTVLSPVSLLYFDTSGNVVLRQYEDMVVNACGCR
uniref:bone morphogenetic protein 15-like n=1 Tax=Styela clava TaxID=7725 RepID=UPI00193930D1|nr:bone morphogenetic protein 15-like [Styela clava]